MDRSVFYGKKWDFTMEVVFYRLDRAMRDEKLYLKPGITLSALADMAGTNRTYDSRSICA